ncbi:hypothetical protein [Sphingomonas sp. MS122]
MTVTTWGWHCAVVVTVRRTIRLRIGRLTTRLVITRFFATAPFDT